MRELIYKALNERLIDIEAHLDWADNYGLSDDDIQGWLYCKQLELEKEKLKKEIESLKKYM